MANEKLMPNNLANDSTLSFRAFLKAIFMLVRFVIYVFLNFVDNSGFHFLVRASIKLKPSPLCSPTTK
jgi:hypothetical protein